MSARFRGSTGDEITYFSDAQLPRSMIRQRSLQKGTKGSSVWTFFRQIGHRIALSNHYERRTGSRAGLQDGCTRQLTGQVVVVRLGDPHPPELARPQRRFARVRNVADAIDIRSLA